MKEHLKNLNMKQSSTIIYNEIKELLKWQSMVK
jgi:hypothetical protein